MTDVYLKYIHIHIVKILWNSWRKNYNV